MIIIDNKAIMMTIEARKCPTDNPYGYERIIKQIKNKTPK